MDHYRFQVISSAGEIDHSVGLLCDTDREAVSAVVRHRGREAVELWYGGRLVVKFAAIPTAKYARKSQYALAS